MIKNKTLGLTLMFVALFSLSNLVQALPAGHNQLRLQTGTPKRTGETAFSYMVTWRKGEANLRRANGLTFINGVGTQNPTSATEVARKITNSLNAGVAIESPHDRGAAAKYNKDRSEVLVTNKEGFDLSQITVRDYTNQPLHFDLPGGDSFQDKSIAVAIDFVYSAAVEYVDGFSSGVDKKAAGGHVTVKLGNDSPIEIQTAGKTTQQIEKELAQVLGAGARFSATPLYPNFVELRSKNYKTFDGGEMQLLASNYNSITIDVNDSGLGVLTKFNFPDVNKPTEIAENINYIIALIIAGIGLAFFVVTRNAKSA